MGAALADVDVLVDAAAHAADTWAATPRPQRARIVRAVADALDAAAEQLVPIAQAETNLPEPRLRGELIRTTFQLRLMAEELVSASYLRVRIDPADSDWPMGSRPDLRRTAVPLGPVLVFAASNFPFAFSVAGGDTASALAAGCSVIVKAHEGHPRLSDATARLVASALDDAGAPTGLFALIHDPESARAVLGHAGIQGAAFTGSISAGRALFDLASARPNPIPFYGELGSVNPVFVSRQAAATRAPEIVDGFVGSFTTGAGQFCTKPGILLVPAESDILQLLSDTVFPDGAPMLNERIAEQHARSRQTLSSAAGASVLNLGTGQSSTLSPVPSLITTTADELLSNTDRLLDECFGPTALVVTYRDDHQLLAVARILDGQLTASVHAEPEETVVPDLVAELSRKVGRLLWNQWPTGVSVTYAQQHGGPYPASTAPSTTSVGTAAMERFVRPLAWQGFPDRLLPDELRSAGGTR